MLTMRVLLPTRVLPGFVALIALGVIAAYIAGPGFLLPTDASCGPVDGGPGIATDKEDYQPNETVIVTGCSLGAFEGQTLTVRITRPDGVTTSDPVVVSAGGFTYNYLLNGIVGIYTVELLDGGNLLASTTFTDATSMTLVINDNVAVTHSVAVTLKIAWVGTDPSQARFANVEPPTLGCPGPSDPSWSAWMAITEIGSTNTDTFLWSLAAGATGFRQVCAQSADGPVGIPTPATQLTALDTIWYTVANPPLLESCGIDMVLVIDSSGSINSTELAQMKVALKSFVAAFLPETPTEMAIIEFDTSAAVTQAFTNNETSLNNAIDAAVGGGFTNWDDALFDARSLLPHRPTKPDVIVFASDGNPNRRGGHVALGHSAVVAAVTEQQSLDWATDESDTAKTDGARIIGVGIGGDLDTVNMSAVTGNTVSPPAPINSSVDVITTNFATLAASLETLAVELCGGTIVAHKIIDGDGNLGTTGDQANGANWTFTTNVDPPDSSLPASGDTDLNGLILFDIDLGIDDSATVDVIEPGEPGFVFISAACTKPDGPDADTDPDPVGTPAGSGVNDIAVGKLDIISCTFYNTNTAQFLVSKDFVPNSAANVAVSLSCTSGTVANDDPTASESDPANFTITGFSAGTICTATEAVPAGYTANQAACVGILITTGGTSACAIINTLNTAQFLVNKDFVPNNAADVAVSLVCSSGTVVNDDPGASEADPANFTINGFLVGATCTAAETIPAGYTANQSACQNVALTLAGTSSCTIVNTLNTATFTVSKNFSDDNAAAVTIALVCTTGTIIVNDATATEVPPDTADFIVTGFTPPASCTATETIPPGYTPNQTACLNVAITPGGASSCTVINTANTATFDVSKDFVPNNAANVTVSLSCTSGGVTNVDTTASEADPANFIVTAFVGATTCTATESVPSGYIADQSACLNVPITPGGSASCTIVNNQAGVVTVIKDAVPDGPQDFDFACSLLAVFPLDDDADGTLANSETFPNVVPGAYTCTEANELGWTISISCIDPDGGSTVSGPTANIDVDPGETVTCTFTNTFHPGPPAVGGFLGIVESNESPRSTGVRNGSALGLLAVGSLAVLVAMAVVAWLTLRCIWMPASRR